MYEVIQLFEALPAARKINLELKNIKDITQMMTVLSKFKNLSEISLHGNKLTSIPPMDTLRNLKILDLSNNPIKIDNIFIDRLYSISKLEELYVSCNREDQMRIIENITTLKALNGQNIIRQKFLAHTLEQQLGGLQQKLGEEMKKMKETYNKLAGSLELNDTPTNKEKISKSVREEQFNFIYKDIQQEMTYFYSGLQDKLSREGVFAYCKNKLTIILDNLMIRILDEVNNDTIIKIYQQICRIKSENFDFLLRIIFNTSYEKYINDETEKPTLTNRLRKQTIYQNQIFRLKKETEDARKEQMKMEKLVERQQQIIQKIKQPLLNKSPIRPKALQKSSSVSKLPKKSPSAKSLTKPSTFGRSPSARSFNKPNNSKRQNGQAQSYGPKSNHNIKNITKQQLVKLIEQIMADKRKYNLRNLTKGECFETAEEFIFTYFSRRYGLKEVALEWSLSIIKAIQNFCKESIQIEIFGKILKNQLYEEYYDQFKQFGKEIEKVLRESHLEKQHINQGHFRKLFFYFFSYQNEETFDKILKSFTFPLTIPELTYFLQSYKLAFEEKHMKTFIEIFNRLDGDDDSALTAGECKDLITRLVQSNKSWGERQAQLKCQELYGVVDCFRKNKLIFSQVFQIVHKII